MSPVHNWMGRATSIPETADKILSHPPATPPPHPVSSVSVDIVMEKDIKAIWCCVHVRRDQRAVSVNMF